MQPTSLAGAAGVSSYEGGRVRLVIPGQLYSETSTLEHELVRAGESLGVTQAECTDIIELLPDELKSARAFFNLLTKMWCYEYGQAYDRLAGGGLAYGADQCPPVERLFLCLQAALRFLSKEQVEGVVARLAVPAKHDEVMAEFAPVLRLQNSVQAQYEVGGYGPGNTNIDWLISPSSDRAVLLEVKCRKLDLISHLEQIVRSPDSRVAPPPEAQPEKLFLDVEGKFEPHPRSETLQGAWLHVPVKQDERALDAAFADLDPLKVHFAILGGWGAEAHILANDKADRDYLVSVFRLDESDRFVIRDADTG